MQLRKIIYPLVLLVLLCGTSKISYAQFKKNAFSQNYNDTTYRSKSDTVAQFFSFKDFFGGLAHKNTIKIGTMFGGSIFLPGTAQIYNKDYWKLPIVYGGIGAFAGTGGYYFHQYNKSVKARKQYFENLGNMPPGLNYSPPPEIDYKSKTMGTWMMVGAGIVYWGSLLDGVVSYEREKYPHPGRAAIYSILLPGLGQAYNGEYWKMPIYWGGLAASGYFLYNNHTNYVRFKRIHNEATNPEGGYTGPIDGETAKWYRDVYRRYRDYSILAVAAVYLLQVIDANVFAYMHDFEVTDDISVSVEPTVITPDYGNYTFNTPRSGENAVGLKLGLRF